MRPVVRPTARRVLKITDPAGNPVDLGALRRAWRTLCWEAANALSRYRRRVHGCRVGGRADPHLAPWGYTLAPQGHKSTRR